MRATSLMKQLLGMKGIVVEKVGTKDGALVAFVRPRNFHPRCSCCGKRRPGYDRLEPRYWRHLDFGGVRVLLCCELRRVNCPKCGVVVERVEWSATPTSRFTLEFEEMVGCLAQRCDKTTVTELMGIAWRTVGDIIERVMARHRPEDPLANLKRMGVDELSYRKGHHYLTLVANQDTGWFCWGKDGKTTEILKSFFDELGEKRSQAIELVSMDMSAAYAEAVREKAPNAEIVYDRFHVQQLVSKALDNTRRDEWQRLRLDEGQEAAREIKGYRWPLLKNPWNMTDEQKGRLAELPKLNSRLYRAYLLKETFAGILDRRQPNVAEEKLWEWCSWASHSRLAEFVKTARTIREHLVEIVRYIKYRCTNAVSEGLNNKARLLTRRAYGFHSAEATIAMIMLCCTGLQLPPALKTVQF